MSRKNPWAGVCCRPLIEVKPGQKFYIDGVLWKVRGWDEAFQAWECRSFELTKTQFRLFFDAEIRKMIGISH